MVLWSSASLRGKRIHMHPSRRLLGAAGFSRCSSTSCRSSRLSPSVADIWRQRARRLPGRSGAHRSRSTRWRSCSPRTATSSSPRSAATIKFYTSLTDTTPTVFADLNTNVHNYWDRGLMGLAVDPGLLRLVRTSTSCTPTTTSSARPARPPRWPSADALVPPGQQIRRPLPEPAPGDDRRLRHLRSAVAPDRIAAAS